jgi:aspartyl aminopeptidase
MHMSISQDRSTFIQSLLGFLDHSPTPFHAVASMVEQFEKAGFIALDEQTEWQLERGKAYYVTRNDSSIVAFRYGLQSELDTGIRLVGAHTDSPCLKVKPTPELFRKGYFQLGVEVYGGALLNPWFDRDLSMAGRVTYKNKSGKVKSGLVNFKKPIACIPSLAIHLDREVNQSKSVNPQLELPVILMQATESEAPAFTKILQTQLEEESSHNDVVKVLDFEILLYDTQPAQVVGLKDEFIASARLDNLLSCYVGMQALLSADSSCTAFLTCNDHEEVGSTSAEGAAGPFLKQVLERVWSTSSEHQRIMSRSMMISADNAHGVHPNYVSKHDENHGPILNKGPVIKQNANQRYATNSETSSLYKWLSEEESVRYQQFVVRSDMACGSTIGPISAAVLGIKTLDIGVPQWAMHSIREIAGTEDSYALFRVLKRFYTQLDLSLVSKKN